MNSIRLTGILLKRKGPANTLAMAEAHNRRTIPAEQHRFGHIDPSRSALNHELISLNGISLEDTILAVLHKRGVDLKHRTNKRPDKGYAIEWLFTVTVGYTGNHLELYADCLSWLESYFPDCPLVHAVVHYDENEPHMHVIMIPLQGSRLPASNVLSYKGGARTRINSLYAAIGGKHGLVPRASLRGAVKKAAAKAVIEVLNHRGVPAVLQHAWPAMKACIQNSPDGFLDPLGITIAQLPSYCDGAKPTGMSPGRHPT